MNPIKNILIAGLGAIGGAYAMKFYGKEGIRLRVLADGERKKRYLENGFIITEEDMDRWDEVLYNMPPDSRPSMLNDLESGRRTEIDMLGGTVCELGRRYGVPTPVNEAFYRAIRAMEKLL
ncbi:MAG: ketopantoate reductase C-terminal domain-containing protein [Bacillota bacterium]|nr:ketopantoate reductase C-terminal domain-containing protein [Bacillota bacterium]